MDFKRSAMDFYQLAVTCSTLEHGNGSSQAFSDGFLPTRRQIASAPAMDRGRSRSPRERPRRTAAQQAYTGFRNLVLKELAQEEPGRSYNWRRDEVRACPSLHDIASISHVL